MSVVHREALRLPRDAASPRQVGRAGAVWRLMQELAVDGAAAVGWPPRRCRAAGFAFLVSEMTVHHYAEVGFGEALEGTTWMRRVRRGTLSDREVRLHGRQLLAAGTQRWAHVSLGPDGPRPCRAAPPVLDAFAPVQGPDALALAAPAAATASPGEPFSFTLTVWHGWMDAMGHANHPATVDWCEEALAQALAARGLDPVAVVPLAEQVRFRRGVFAGDALTLTGRREGLGARGVVLSFEVTRSDGVLVAQARLERGLLHAPARVLFDALA